MVLPTSAKLPEGNIVEEASSPNRYRSPERDTAAKFKLGEVWDEADGRGSSERRTWGTVVVRIGREEVGV